MSPWDGGPVVVVERQHDLDYDHKTGLIQDARQLELDV